MEVPFWEGGGAIWIAGMSTSGLRSPLHVDMRTLCVGNESFEMRTLYVEMSDLPQEGLLHTPRGGATWVSPCCMSK